MSRTQRLVAAAAICAVAGCGPKQAATVPVTAPAPDVPLETRIGWVLRLEQQRQLREPQTVFTPPATPFARATRADLELLVRDDDPRIRRRAALAIGRVGMADGVGALTAALADPDEEARAGAAFGLGLLGARAAVTPLVAALKDPSPLVRARVIDALGLIADPLAAGPIAAASGDCAPWLASVEADDEQWPKAPYVEICRQALFALVRLRDFDGISKIALDAQGLPVTQWWPVAFALQRSGDPRAAPALLQLARIAAVHSPAFALRGLAGLKDARVVPIALEHLTRSDGDSRVKVAAIRALGQLRATDAVPRLIDLSADAAAPPGLALEAIAALGAIGDARAFSPMVELWAHPDPAIRAAAIASAAKADVEGFLLLRSTTPPDRQWSVRAALPPMLATLPADRIRGALEELAADADDRVKTPALEALTRVGAPDLTRRLFDALEAQDYVLRATAARLIGERKLDAGVASLVRAYQRGEADAANDARLAALEALAKYGGDEALATLRRALADRDWPVRLRAAALLKEAGDTAAEPVRPAPIRQPPEFFESDRLLRPPYSPHAYIETRRGTIEIELNVVESPFTTHAFMELARAGFYNGLKVHRLVPNFVIQAGDPRGDGEGGPGFTIRDELSPLPFVRGTVGVALAGPDTGGSQFFITLSPQPHLDAKYTAFGRVVKGFELLDRIAIGDEIREITIWDGTSSSDYLPIRLSTSGTSIYPPSDHRSIGAVRWIDDR
jgi:cyclophilin family peptidyl-prolyl cis-trans isomerase/HEAT repeat protein